MSGAGCAEGEGEGPGGEAGGEGGGSGKLEVEEAEEKPEVEEEEDDAAAQGGQSGAGGVERATPGQEEGGGSGEGEAGEGGGGFDVNAGHHLAQCAGGAFTGEGAVGGGGGVVVFDGGEDEAVAEAVEVEEGCLALVHLVSGEDGGVELNLAGGGEAVGGGEAKGAGVINGDAGEALALVVTQHDFPARPDHAVGPIGAEPFAVDGEWEGGDDGVAVAEDEWDAVTVAGGQGAGAGGGPEGWSGPAHTWGGGQVFQISLHGEGVLGRAGGGGILGPGAGGEEDATEGGHLAQQLALVKFAGGIRDIEGPIDGQQLGFVGGDGVEEDGVVELGPGPGLIGEVLDNDADQGGFPGWGRAGGEAEGETVFGGAGEGAPLHQQGEYETGQGGERHGHGHRRAVVRGAGRVHPPRGWGRGGGGNKGKVGMVGDGCIFRGRSDSGA